MHFTAIRVAAALSVLGLAACDSPLEPTDVAGTYVYAPPGGLRMQFTLNGTTQEYVLAIQDTLTLRADGTGMVSGISTWITPPPDAPTVGARAVEFIYEIDDRRLRAFITTPNVCINPYEVCAWNYRVDGSSVIQENGAAPEYRSVYRRVGPPLR